MGLSLAFATFLANCHMWLLITVKKFRLGVNSTPLCPTDSILFMRLLIFTLKLTP